jgi:hypothetical protein
MKNIELQTLLSSDKKRLLSLEIPVGESNFINVYLAIAASKNNCRTSL